MIERTPHGDSRHTSMKGREWEREVRHLIFACVQTSHTLIKLMALCTW